MISRGNDNMSRMHESSQDLIALVTMIEHNVKDIAHGYHRKHGVELKFPESLIPDLKRWRELHTRHLNGDFRFKKAERRSCEAVAQWTLDIKAELVGKEKQVHVWHW